jgi:DNA-binding beta-propeller fold protein YncE
LRGAIPWWGIASGATSLPDPANSVGPAGNNPSPEAFDSAKNENFVANLYSNNVSVIADATDKVVAVGAVNQGTVGVAYATAEGEVFVANSGSNNVSVISDSTPV